MGYDSKKITNISNRHKCIFIHIPKTAGTSVKEALDLSGRGHLPWKYYCLKHKNEWNHYVKFTIVRNPWDRVISAFNYAKLEKSYWHNNRMGPHPDYKTVHNKTFAECCDLLKNARFNFKHESWLPQNLWIANRKDGTNKLMVDHILRYENIQKDFNNLCKILKIKEHKLPHLNSSHHKDYRQYYNEKTMKIIEKLYSEDIELFKYKF